jgi:L-lysine 6-transaminase
MVRCEMILETMAEERLVDNAAAVGDQLRRGLEALASEMPDRVSNARGRGLLCAIDLETRALRDALIAEARDRRRLLLLPCGDRSIRFRPALTLSAAEADEGLGRLREAVGALPASG